MTATTSEVDEFYRGKIGREGARLNTSRKLGQVTNYDADGWRERSACIDIDPRIFSEPRDESEVAVAKDYCDECDDDVKAQCLAFALSLEFSAQSSPKMTIHDTRLVPGVWGGLDAVERHRLHVEAVTAKKVEKEG